MYTSLDLIQIVLNHINIEDKQGNVITFKILDLIKLPMAKFESKSYTEKNICFEIGCKSYTINCSYVCGEAIVLQVTDDAPIPPEQLQRIADKLQLLFDEVVTVSSFGFTSAVKKNKTLNEEDKELVNYIKGIVDKN